MLRQMFFAALSSVVVTPPVTSGRVVKINLYASFNTTALSGWNNFDISNASIALLDSTGASSGITLTRTLIGAADGPFSPPASTDPDFPTDVLRMEWYVGGTDVITFTFSGLNTAKTYTVRTASYDPSTVGATIINFGGAQTGFPEGVPVFFTFPSLTPNASGVISGTFTGPGNSNPVINALIITEN